MHLLDPITLKKNYRKRQQIFHETITNKMLCTFYPKAEYIIEFNIPLFHQQVLCISR